MGYPLDESFENTPLSGYYSVSSAVVGYNALDQCLDVSGPRTFAWVRFNQPGSGNLWFEADLEIVEDNTPYNPVNGSPNYKYFGIQLSSSSSFTEGVRFGFYQDHKFIGYYNSINQGTDIQVGRTIYGGSNLGQRYTLGIKILEDPNYSDVRSIQVFVDQILIYELYGSPNWSTPSKLWIPEVFRYNCNIRIHAIRGVLDSGLTGWPVSHATRGYTLRPFRSPQNDRLYSTEDTKFANRHVSLRPMKQSFYFHGKGSIVGTVKQASPDNLPISRRVYLIEEDSYIVVAEVWSDKDGNYRFDQLDERLHWTVLASDHEGNFRTVLANNLKAVRV